MAKTYGAIFGSGDPRDNTGLSPTFIIFQIIAGTSLAPPGITELPSSGMYYFQYGTTQAVYFQLDGGSALATADRYIEGILDPIQSVDEKVGTTADSFGSTSVDPSTLFGYVKRNLEMWEGDETFSKSSGVLDMYSRGSSTLLREKTLANNTTETTKT